VLRVARAAMPPRKLFDVTATALTAQRLPTPLCAQLRGQTLAKREGVSDEEDAGCPGGGFGWRRGRV
jgi:hypothetical protein